MGKLGTKPPPGPAMSPGFCTPRQAVIICAAIIIGAIAGTLTWLQTGNTPQGLLAALVAFGGAVKVLDELVTKT